MTRLLLRHKMAAERVAAAAVFCRCCGGCGSTDASSPLPLMMRGDESFSIKKVSHDLKFMRRKHHERKQSQINRVSENVSAHIDWSVNVTPTRL
ncbi:hypothetical protein F2P81_025154 [Scophthalmus maximus]|uniref:Uncharacterized protein n=1 Tax=Scophthalmus maximus TaxID=52904 RepID=A0A6A4RR63_SCOMX|nr:hypothetical protein F2P81_025154 [Scophthalmus maximus]